MPVMVLATSGCPGQSGEPSRVSDPLQVAESEYLFVWTTDADSVDLNFLAVLDARSESPSYGDVLTTLAVPADGRIRGHHTEHRMPPDRQLFANDFGTGETYVLDLTDPLRPKVASSFFDAGPLASPHSFERLPNGNVLATMQNEGSGNGLPGGLAEIDPQGRVIRWGSAAEGGPNVRPYSLAIVPDLDRVVTGSADMRGEVDGAVVQVWRLRDLALLHTLEVPAEWGLAAEPRLLEDGTSVLVSTFGCTLLRVDDLASESPSLSRVHDFGGSSCALAVVAGRFWIQAVPAANGLIALDVSDPTEVLEIGSVRLAADDWPHWIALSPSQRRLVVTGYAGTRHRVLMVDFDPGTGALSVDEDFRSAGATRPGVSFDRTEWPHGSSGPADPHGAVFSLPN